MANSNAARKKKSTSSSQTKNSNRTNTKSKSKSSGPSRQKTKASVQRKSKNNPFRDEIILIVTAVVSILLILSHMNLGGLLTTFINDLTFGLMGMMARIFPFALFFGTAFAISNRGNPAAKRKWISAIVMFVVLCTLLQLIQYPDLHMSDMLKSYSVSASSKAGGGFIGSLFSTTLVNFVGIIGAYVVVVAILVILVVFVTEILVLTELGKKSYDRIHEMKERRRYQVEEYEDEHKEYEPKVLLHKEHPKRKAKTFTFQRDDRESTEEVVEESPLFVDEELEMDVEALDIPIQRANPAEASAKVPFEEKEEVYEKELKSKFSQKEEQPDIDSGIAGVVHGTQGNSTSDVMDHESELMESWNGNPEVDHTQPDQGSKKNEKAHRNIGEKEKEMLNESVSQSIHASLEPVKKEYVFPSIDLLSKPKAASKGMTDFELKETALKLQSTLESFGVRVSVTNVSCGPTVTRYELQPEQGVKVSQITKLADDIKLNLATTDIRIEAPIPGKAAVGVEVPNKENSMVTFRELIESNAFKTHSSDIAFAVGKDIGGQTVVTDIAKMPHLLIAGATGSGKSVCINTLIMSILYKANPEDVKLIMVDPKVVELSIYNGIPHLLIPVVTDPKKASAALNWAVAEMTERYKKFADLSVRDIKGYNQKIATLPENGDVKYQKMPQIVIIVDELADLMMVAPGEVEDAICRLAQMARAAGLHLIIATQRPSVNVITGLIKANVPSRIAFSVSSSIDSRTILDGAGAEKLLGKGDMLFFPSGYPKPVRVQGAFVSDKEVNAVVEFLSKQNLNSGENKELEGQITSITSTEVAGSKENIVDEYFVEAGKFIIEKDKASIGMLQRVFKIGFNRAARIMDQLCEAGVVGPEEGTKPRKVLMSIDEFEGYVDEYV